MADLKHHYYSELWFSASEMCLKRGAHKLTAGFCPILGSDDFLLTMWQICQINLHYDGQNPFPFLVNFEDNILK